MSANSSNKIARKTLHVIFIFSFSIHNIFATEGTPLAGAPLIPIHHPSPSADESSRKSSDSSSTHSESSYISIPDFDSDNSREQFISQLGTLVKKELSDEQFPVFNHHDNWKWGDLLKFVNLVQNNEGPRGILSKIPALRELFRQSEVFIEYSDKKSDLTDLTRDYEDNHCCHNCVLDSTKVITGVYMLLAITIICANLILNNRDFSISPSVPIIGGFLTTSLISMILVRKYKYYSLVREVNSLKLKLTSDLGCGEEEFEENISIKNKKISEESFPGFPTEFKDLLFENLFLKVRNVE